MCPLNKVPGKSSNNIVKLIPNVATDYDKVAREQVAVTLAWKYNIYLHKVLHVKNITVTFVMDTKYHKSENFRNDK